MSNTVTKDKYRSKYFLYNDRKQCVCRECSKLGRDIPVRKKDLIEFLDCSVCSKEVKYESIFCNLCQHWVHPYCNKIDKLELGKLSNHWVHKQCIGYFKNRAEYQNFLHYYSTKHWDCPTCMSDILPFTLLEQEEFLMLLLDMNVQPVYLNKDNFQCIYKFIQICIA